MMERATFVITVRTRTGAKSVATLCPVRALHEIQALREAHGHEPSVRRRGRVFCEARPHQLAAKNSE